MKEKLKELYTKEEISADGLMKAVTQGWITTEEAAEILAGNVPEEEQEQAKLPIYRAAKLAEISAACNATILAGVDVELSDGTTGHFSLQETDQINLTTAYNAVQMGAAGYPYHADGEICKLYSAEDIVTIGDAATAFKLYHLTYCNHMMAWARRAETAEELATIVYGVDLPEDLAANMAEVMTNAG